MTGNRDKIVWLSILQGFTMLLVVIGHSDLNRKFDSGFEAIGFIYKYFHPFRMQLFILISGYLFQKTKISRNKSFGNVISDKSKRLLIPFLAFTIIAYFMKICFASLIKNPVNNSFYEFFLYPGKNPLSALWFIDITFMLMMLYPLYKFVLTKKNYTILFTLLCAALYYLFPKDIELFCFSSAASLIIFFWIGILLAEKKGDKIFENRLVFTLSFIIYSIIIVFSYIKGYDSHNLITSLLGITWAISMSKILSKTRPGTFITFRNNTYQIFLLSIFPQMAIEIIYRVTGSHYFFAFYISNILIGLYIPVLIAAIIKALKLKYLYMIIGLSITDKPIKNKIQEMPV